MQQGRWLIGGSSSFARSPSSKYLNKVLVADHSVGHDVGGAVGVTWAPVADHGDEVGVVDCSVCNDVGDAFAIVWNQVAIDIGNTAKKHVTGISDPIVVAVIGIATACITLVRNAVGVDVLACPTVDVEEVERGVGVAVEFACVDECVAVCV